MGCLPRLTLPPLNPSSRPTPPGGLFWVSLSLSPSPQLLRHLQHSRQALGIRPELFPESSTAALGRRLTPPGGLDRLLILPAPPETGPRTESAADGRTQTRVPSSGETKRGRESFCDRTSGKKPKQHFAVTKGGQQEASQLAQHKFCLRLAIQKGTIVLLTTRPWEAPPSSRHLLKCFK